MSLLKGSLDIDIRGIENDSRKIQGHMFIAIKGFTVDGHKYIDEAIENGASCIVVEKDIVDLRDDVTVIKVEDTLDSFSKIILNFLWKSFEENEFNRGNWY